MQSYYTQIEFIDLENTFGAYQVDTTNCNTITIINKSNNAYINVNGVPLLPSNNNANYLQFRGNENELYNGKLILSEGAIFGIGITFIVIVIKKIYI